MNLPRYWGLVPAAGVGSRFGAETPKQYLALGSLTVIEHSVQRLLALASIEKVIVALHPQDQRWESLAIAHHPRVLRVDGGVERQHSVCSALTALSTFAHDDDFVLVHDAARPCVRIADMQRLIEAVPQDGAGGILGLPMADTVKRVRVENGSTIITGTSDRSELWTAQTPQLFKLGLLRSALQNAIAQNIRCTDEAMAMEIVGYAPLLVAGHRDNIKITLPEDLLLANFILVQQALSQQALSQQASSSTESD